jgi:hypothetical protein
MMVSLNPSGEEKVGEGTKAVENSFEREVITETLV